MAGWEAERHMGEGNIGKEVYMYRHKCFTEKHNDMLSISSLSKYFPITLKNCRKLSENILDNENI